GLYPHQDFLYIRGTAYIRGSPMTKQAPAPLRSAPELHSPDPRIPGKPTSLNRLDIFFILVSLSFVLAPGRMLGQYPVKGKLEGEEIILSTNPDSVEQAGLNATATKVYISSTGAFGNRFYDKVFTAPKGTTIKDIHSDPKISMYSKVL